MVPVPTISTEKLSPFTAVATSPFMAEIVSSWADPLVRSNVPLPLSTKVNKLPSPAVDREKLPPVEVVRSENVLMLVRTVSSAVIVPVVSFALRVVVDWNISAFGPNITCRR